MRLRIIPFTIIIASLFLMVKVVDLIQGGQRLSDTLIVSQVQAQSEEPPPEQKPAEEKPVEAAPAEPQGEAAAEGEHGEGAAKKDANENPNVSKTHGEVADRRFTSVEVELLQKLGKRREELEAWEANLQIKETTLNATEKRIDEKIAQVEAMQRAVKVALEEYNKIEDTEITSLVKIYENMKPGDAARIFDELERPILLLIVDRMSERKAAPILAAMDPKRAKQVTIDLAEQRRLKTNALNGSDVGM